MILFKYNDILKDYEYLRKLMLIDVSDRCSASKCDLRLMYPHEVVAFELFIYGNAPLAQTTHEAHCLERSRVQ